MAKILIIDDDHGILGAINAILNMENHQVATAENSKYLDSLDDKNTPDLIFLDLYVSGENGKQILKRIKTEEKTSKIPVIMLSAYPNVEAEILEAGADDFIAKPFDMDDLLGKVKKHLK